jgi:hypothetical protein
MFYVCPFRDTDKKYTSTGTFKEHMYEFHTSAFNETQLDGMLREQERDQYRLFLDCPLCGFVPPNKHLRSEHLLLQHIANHLEVISLVSIPLSMANNDDKDPSRSSLPTTEFTQSIMTWESPSSSSLKRRDDEWGGIVSQSTYEQSDGPVLQSFHHYTYEQSDDPVLHSFRQRGSHHDQIPLPKKSEDEKFQQEDTGTLPSSSSKPQRTIRLHLDSCSLH